MSRAGIFLKAMNAATSDARSALVATKFWADDPPIDRVVVEAPAGTVVVVEATDVPVDGRTVVWVVVGEVPQAAEMHAKAPAPTRATRRPTFIVTHSCRQLLIEEISYPEMACILGIVVGQSGPRPPFDLAMNNVGDGAGPIGQTGRVPGLGRGGYRQPHVRSFSQDCEARGRTRSGRHHGEHLVVCPAAPAQGQARQVGRQPTCRCGAPAACTPALPPPGPAPGDGGARGWTPPSPSSCKTRGFGPRSI